MLNILKYHSLHVRNVLPGNRLHFTDPCNQGGWAPSRQCILIFMNMKIIANSSFFLFFSFLPSFLPSFLSSFLSSFHHSSFPSFLPFFLPFPALFVHFSTTYSLGANNLGKQQLSLSLTFAYHCKEWLWILSKEVRTKVIRMATTLTTAATTNNIRSSSNNNINHHPIVNFILGVIE